MLAYVTYNLERIRLRPVCGLDKTAASEAPRLQDYRELRTDGVPSHNADHRRGP